MSLTFHNNCRAAALDGVLALLIGGDFRLLTAGLSALAALRFQTSGGAFAAASAASPAVAQSNPIATDTEPTAGTIGAFQLRTASGTVMISGTVAAGSPSGDLNLSDVVIPAEATEVSCSAGLQISLQMS